ncbi:MAG: hypothetical protein AB8I08_04650 [Sandaracinaceae bacterium]
MSPSARTCESAVGSVALTVALAACLLVGCVDTELGLDTEIRSSAVNVTGASAAVTLDIDYRVGEFAEGDRGFQPQAIELYVGGELAAQLVPEAVGEIRGRLSPGESASGTLRGTGDVTGDVCAGDVTVLLRWLDTATTEIGTVEAPVDDVVCG